MHYLHKKLTFAERIYFLYENALFYSIFSDIRWEFIAIRTKQVGR